MHRFAPIFVLAIVSACAPSTYVSDVRYGHSGELVVTRCDFDLDGKPSGGCRESVEEPPAHYAPDALRDVEREALARDAAIDRPRAPHAPDAADVARAMTASGATRLVAQCRAAYAPELETFHFAIAVAPDGAITAIEPYDVGAAFADCADRAVRATTVPPYDGAPVRVEQTLALR